MSKIADCTAAQVALQSPSGTYETVTNLVIHFNSSNGVTTGDNDMLMNNTIGSDQRTNKDLPEQVRFPCIFVPCARREAERLAERMLTTGMIAVGRVSHSLRNTMLSSTATPRLPPASLGKIHT